MREETDYHLEKRFENSCVLSLVLKENGSAMNVGAIYSSENELESWITK